MAKTKDEVLKKYLKIVKDCKGNKPLLHPDLSSKGLTKHTIYKFWGNLKKLEKYAHENHECFNSDPHINRSEEILREYIELRKKLGKVPSRKDIRNHCNFTVNSVNNIFSSIQNLEDAARSKYPKEFKDKPVRHLRNKKTLSSLKGVLKENKRFIITTAVTGTEVHKGFYENLKKLCRLKKAKLLVLLCSDPAKHKDKFEDLGTVPPELAKETIIFEDSKLNSNFHLCTVKLTAKAIRPTSGLARISKKYGSFVYAAPKIALEYASVRNNKDKWPHAIMTTGAVTLPDYRSQMYLSQRTAFIAEHDHEFGALYVEIQDDDRYFFNQIECKDIEEGSFYFENRFFNKGKSKRIRPEFFIMGDLHAGKTCPDTRKAWIDIIKKFKPKKIALHDALNGTSVNGWIRNDIIARHQRSKLGEDDLGKELEYFSEELAFWASLVDEVVMVPSNHNDWLERWLRRADYADDAKNHYMGVTLAKAMLEGHNPIKFAVEEYFEKTISNVVWLGRNEDYFVEGVQINSHGDKGVNGSRGSLKGMETAYGESFSGHSHTAGIFRRNWSVGTSTHLQEEYNDGASTWTNTSGLLYSDGTRSLYNAIAGQFRSKNTA